MPKFSFLNFRRSISLLVHTLLISSCYFLSFILEADFIIGNFLTDIFSMSIILLIFIRIILLYSFGLHRGVWRYVSVVDLIQIIKITTTGTITYGTLNDGSTDLTATVSTLNKAATTGKAIAMSIVFGS